MMRIERLHNEMLAGEQVGGNIWVILERRGVAGHCFYRQPGEGIQIGPNWDLSKALNNRYRLLLLRIDRYPGHFGVLLIKIHLLAFVVVAIKWIIRPKTKKNLFS